MKTLGSLLLGYVLACPLTSRVSLDITQTEWTHLLTYVWILGSGVIWLLICFAAVSAFIILRD